MGRVFEDVYKRQLLKKTIGIENGNFFPTAGAAVPDEICEFVHSVGINTVSYTHLGAGEP